MIVCSNVARAVRTLAQVVTARSSRSRCCAGAEKPVSRSVETRQSGSRRFIELSNQVVDPELRSSAPPFVRSRLPRDARPGPQRDRAADGLGDDPRLAHEPRELIRKERLATIGECALRIGM